MMFISRVISCGKSVNKSLNSRFFIASHSTEIITRSGCYTIFIFCCVCRKINTNSVYRMEKKKKILINLVDSKFAAPGGCLLCCGVGTCGRATPATVRTLFFFYR